MFGTTNQIIANRLEKLSKNGDPLVRLNETMDWNIFMPLLTWTFKKQEKIHGAQKFELEWNMCLDLSLIRWALK